MNLSIFIILVIMLIIISALLGSKKRKPNYGRIAPRPIVTANELEFFHRLQRALPGFHVFPQVAFGAILNTKGGNTKDGLRNRFNRKYADFVICEKETLSIAAIIELDDRTHNSKKDAERDKYLHAAGYTVHRFESRKKPSESAIAALFELPPPTDHARGPKLFSEPSIPHQRTEF